MKTEQPDKTTILLLLHALRDEPDANGQTDEALIRRFIESQADRVAGLEKELAKACLDLDGSIQRERHLNHLLDLRETELTRRNWNAVFGPPPPPTA